MKLMDGYITICLEVKRAFLSATIGVFFIAYRVVSFTFFPYYSVMSKKEVH